MAHATAGAAAVRIVADGAPAGEAVARTGDRDVVNAVYLDIGHLLDDFAERCFRCCGQDGVVPAFSADESALEQEQDKVVEPPGKVVEESDVVHMIVQAIEDPQLLVNELESPKDTVVAEQ